MLISSFLCIRVKYKQMFSLTLFYANIFFIGFIFYMISRINAATYKNTNLSFQKKELAVNKTVNSDISEKVLIYAAWLAIAGIAVNIARKGFNTNINKNGIDSLELKNEITRLKRKLRIEFDEKQKIRFQSEKYSLFRKRIVELSKDKEFKKIRDIKKSIDFMVKDDDISIGTLTEDLAHRLKIAYHIPLTKFKAFIDDVLLTMMAPKVNFEKKYIMPLKEAVDFVKSHASTEPNEFTRDYRNYLLHDKSKSRKPNYNLKDDINEILQKKAHQKAVTDMRQSEDVIKLKELNRKLKELVK